MFKKIIPEGFKDDVSLAVATEYMFKNMMIDHFQINGYDLVKTPLIEYSDKDISDNIFKILVKKNEKKLNIRDDITLQIARLAQTRLFKKNRPLKLCYYGEVVRKKGTMLRPERQFLQIGVECIGEKNFLADVEMMELAFTSLKLVGIKKITIEVSSRVFYDKFLELVKKNSNIEKIKKLIKLKDLFNLLKCLDKKHHKYIKYLFSCTGIYKDKKRFLKHLEIDEFTSKEVSNIENIIKNFSNRNKKINIFLDLCEIDDKNYHSGIRFTFFAENIRGEIARGGRYFVQNSTNGDVATGFTCYMDSILRASKSKLISKKIIVPFEEKKENIKKIKKNGFTVLKHIGDSKITKKLAKKYNCKFYLENSIIKKV